MDLALLELHLPLVAIVAVAAWTDVREGKVYNWLTYPAIALGLFLNAVLWPAGIGLGPAGLGFLVAFIPLFLAYAAGGLGGGDVKLAGAVGAFLGPLLTAYALLYSFLAAAVLCVLLIVRQEGAYGLLDRLVHLRAGEEAEARTPLRFPFAVAVLIGVLWVVVEQHVGGSVLDLIRRQGP